MPWNVQRQGSKYAVVTEGTGNVVSRHATKGAAAAKVRAMYANEPEASSRPRARGKPKKPKPGY